MIAGWCKSSSFYNRFDKNKIIKLTNIWGCPSRSNHAKTASWPIDKATCPSALASALKIASPPADFHWSATCPFPNHSVWLQPMGRKLLIGPALTTVLLVLVKLLVFLVFGRSSMKLEANLELMMFHAFRAVRRFVLSLVSLFKWFWYGWLNVASVGWVGLLVWWWWNVPTTGFLWWFCSPRSRWFIGWSTADDQGILALPWPTMARRSSKMATVADEEAFEDISFVWWIVISSRRKLHGPVGFWIFN